MSRKPVKQRKNSRRPSGRSSRGLSLWLALGLMTIVGGGAFGYLISLSNSDPASTYAPASSSTAETRTPAAKSETGSTSRPENRKGPSRDVPNENQDSRTEAKKTSKPSGTAGKVALTFDAGAASDPGWDILKALREHNIKSTFFMTGRFSRDNPDLLKAIADEGHELANHTWSHPDLTKVPDDEIRTELQRTEEIVQQITEHTTKPYFRPPFGARNKRVLDIAKQEGYECVYWTVDSWDAVKKDITTDFLIKRVMDRIKPEGVVLMHIGSRVTADALPELIEKLDAEGYRMVRVSELEGPLPR